MLCLLLSDLGSNRGLGPISAVSVALAVLAALTFLPAVLVLLGRAAFWPFRPAYGSRAPARAAAGRGWPRSSAGGRGRVLVWQRRRPARRRRVRAHVRRRRHPARRQACAADRVGRGQEALERHFDAGGGSPAVIITPEDDWPAVAEAAAGVDGVAASPRSPAAPRARRRASRSSSTAWCASTRPWTTPPTATAAVDTVQDLRTAVDAASTPTRSWAGTTASNLDTRETGARDLRVIVPSVLLVITLVLALLLRSLVAPLLLVATVVLASARRWAWPRCSSRTCSASRAATRRSC